jgi:hypothetical protein
MRLMGTCPALGWTTFEPAGETTEIEEAKKGWKDAIQRTLSRK